MVFEENRIWSIKKIFIYEYFDITDSFSEQEKRSRKRSQKDSEQMWVLDFSTVLFVCINSAFYSGDTSLDCLDCPAGIFVFTLENSFAECFFYFFFLSRNIQIKYKIIYY